MENVVIVDKINELTANEYNFSLKSAVLDSGADFCVIEIYYKDGILLPAKKKTELCNVMLNILPKKYKYEIKFVKNFISEERITADFENFMKKTFPSITYKIEDVKFVGETFEIKLLIDEHSFAHADDKNLKLVASEKFHKKYPDFEFKVEYISAEVFVEDNKKLLKNIKEEPIEDMMALRRIEVTEKINIVGDPIEENAYYIKDKTAPEENLVFCGKVKNIKDIVIKRKPKEEKNKEKTEGISGEESSELNDIESDENITKSEQAEPEIKYQRKLYKWVLEGFTGSVPCVYFSNKETQAKVEKLDQNSEIIVKGNLEEDKFSNGLSFVVKQISYCKLPEKFEEIIVYHKEKPYYEFVEPEPVTTYKQDDLMSFMIEDKPCDFLIGKTYVCFDFETTGLHYENGDKIIEIGAVKIVDGKITESFLSYVDPEKPIPPESSEISGIVDEDVKGAPKDYEVLQDFYKFTRGAILTGYNIINFDMRFLIGQGKSTRWNFSENEVDDVYKWAQKYVHGVKNYKLGTIAAKLGVVLDNAHRAVFDAQATAEVFIKLANEHMKG